MDIEIIWQNIIAHEGEEFRTTRGLVFTYEVISDHEIVPYRNGEAKWTLSKHVFERALEFTVFAGTEFNNAIIGSSYVRAILEDRRIN